MRHSLIRSSVIRLSMLSVCAAVLIPLVTATEVEASSRHVRKTHHRLGHHQRTGIGFNDFAGMRAAPAARPVTGDVCPGSGRSFECKVWPPPFDQDPDRKVSGSDGGG